MTIGSVLIGPQKLQRAANRPPLAALVDDFLSVSIRIAMSEGEGGPVFAVMQEAFEAAAARVLAHARSGLPAAEQRLLQWLQPLLNRFRALSQATAGLDDPTEMATSILKLADELVASVENLTIEQMRQHVNVLLNAVQHDLGLSATVIQAQVWALLDDMVVRLRAVPADSSPDQRDNRLALASVLRRVKRHLYNVFAFPELNADQIAGELYDLLGRAGFKATAHKAACVGAGLHTVAEARSSLDRLLAPTVAGPLGGGSHASILPIGGGAPDDAEKYLWYASWLLGDKDVKWYQFWKSNADFWVNRERTQVMRRDRQLAAGTDLNWSAGLPVLTEGEPAPQYTFKHVSQESMEKWAYRSAWIAEFFESLLNVLNIHKADLASPIANGLVDIGHGVFKLALDSPFHFWLLTSKGVGDTFWGRWLAKTPTQLSTLLGSFQGWHSKADTAEYKFRFWIVLFMTRFLNVFSNNATAGGARDAFLSVLTLINYDGLRETPDGVDNRPDNRKAIDGVVSLFTTGASWLLVKSVPRKEYVQPFAGPGDHAARMWLLWMLLAGTGFGLLGGFVGTTVAEIIAWAEDWKLLGITMLKSVPKTVLLFWLLLFSFKENDTDKGKYNPTGLGPSDFQGYPDQASSPYKLPYAASSAYLCAQGNQGMWSHNNFNNPSSVYAYDLGLDQGDEVLCARSGTVVDWFDWVPDNQDVTTPGPVPMPTPGQTPSRNWNFIAIRHDRPGDPIAAHDRDETTAPVVTYAVYGHGRTGSVRQVFGTRGVAPGAIIGTQVAQGQPIMLAGSTGNSLHDHLHIEVRIGPAPPPAPPVALSMLSNKSIPFVFRDVTTLNPFTPNGVPQSLKFYTSENTRIP